jgi:hypothetical protein
MTIHAVFLFSLRLAAFPLDQIRKKTTISLRKSARAESLTQLEMPESVCMHACMHVYLRGVTLKTLLTFKSFLGEGGRGGVGWCGQGGVWREESLLV